MEEEEEEQEEILTTMQSFSTVNEDKRRIKVQKEGEDEIQSTLQQCSRVVLVGQGDYVFVVHMEGKKEEEEEEKLENKEDEGEEEREEERRKDQEEAIQYRRCSTVLLA